MARALLIDPQTIKNKSNIDNNIDDSFLTNALIKAQDEILQPLIGTSLYDRLQDGAINGNLDTNYKNLVYNYIYNILIYGSITYLIKDGTYRISNAGTVKNGSTSFPTLADNELNVVVKENQKVLDNYSKLLFEYLEDNISLFQEFDDSPNVGNTAYQSLSTRDIYIDMNKILVNNNKYSNRTYF